MNVGVVPPMTQATRKTRGSGKLTAKLATALIPLFMIMRVFELNANEEVTAFGISIQFPETGSCA